MEPWEAEQERQRGTGWSPGQGILNSTGARVPEHTFKTPVPVVVRIVWADDGEEYIHTVAAGWSGQNVYVRLPDALPLHRGVAGRRGRHPALVAVSTV